MYICIVVLYNTFLVKSKFERNVTVEYILFCIIIIIVSPSGDVVPLIRDVIVVFVHVKYWGKTSILNWVSITEKSIIKMYFWVSQGNSSLEARRIYPCWVIMPLIWLIYIGEVPPSFGHGENSRNFTRERRNNPYEDEEVVYYYFLGITLYLVEVYIDKFLLGSPTPRGFPRINICVLFYSMLVVLSMILFFLHNNFWINSNTRLSLILISFTSRSP